MSFPQLKSKIIKNSNKLSNLLAIYSSNESSLQSQLEIQSKIESQLSNLSSLINDLSRIIDSSDIIKFNQLQRFKDELKRNRQDFQRLNNDHQRKNLLNNITTEETTTDTTYDNYLLDEQLRVNNQHSIVDSLINQVIHTRDEMLRQDSLLSNISTNLSNSISSIPMINNLLNKINARQRKSAFIISSVLVVCLIILWFSL